MMAGREAAKYLDETAMMTNWAKPAARARFEVSRGKVASQEVRLHTRRHAKSSEGQLHVDELEVLTESVDSRAAGHIAVERQRSSKIVSASMEFNPFSKSKRLTLPLSQEVLDGSKGRTS